MPVRWPSIYSLLQSGLIVAGVGVLLVFLGVLLRLSYEKLLHFKAQAPGSVWGFDAPDFYGDAPQSQHNAVVKQYLYQIANNGQVLTGEKPKIELAGSFTLTGDIQTSTVLANSNATTTLCKDAKRNTLNKQDDTAKLLTFNYLYLSLLYVVQFEALWTTIYKTFNVQCIGITDEEIYILDNDFQNARTCRAKYHEQEDEFIKYIPADAVFLALNAVKHIALITERCALRVKERIVSALLQDAPRAVCAYFVSKLARSLDFAVLYSETCNNDLSFKAFISALETLNNAHNVERALKCAQQLFSCDAFQRALRSAYGAADYAAYFANDSNNGITGMGRNSALIKIANTLNSNTNNENSSLLLNEIKESVLPYVLRVRAHLENFNNAESQLYMDIIKESALQVARMQLATRFLKTADIWTYEYLRKEKIEFRKFYSVFTFQNAEYGLEAFENVFPNELLKMLFGYDNEETGFLVNLNKAKLIIGSLVYIEMKCKETINKIDNSHFSKLIKIADLSTCSKENIIVYMYFLRNLKFFEILNENPYIEETLNNLKQIIIVQLNGLRRNITALSLNDARAFLQVTVIINFLLKQFTSVTLRELKALKLDLFIKNTNNINNSNMLPDTLKQLCNNSIRSSILTENLLNVGNTNASSSQVEATAKSHSKKEPHNDVIVQFISGAHSSTTRKNCAIYDSDTYNIERLSSLRVFLFGKCIELSKATNHNSAHKDINSSTYVSSLTHNESNTLNKQLSQILRVHAFVSPLPFSGTYASPAHVKVIIKKSIQQKPPLVTISFQVNYSFEHIFSDTKCFSKYSYLKTICGDAYSICISVLLKSAVSAVTIKHSNAASLSSVAPEDHSITDKTMFSTFLLYISMFSIGGLLTIIGLVLVALSLIRRRKIINSEEQGAYISHSYTLIPYESVPPVVSPQAC